ncbi:hypothetical protein EIP86_002417 [Pleurotus ostreatoroseus]|nr:hypothetical protein EIP86_002417 [Pleurotus ostreatoroseus]
MLITIARYDDLWRNFRRAAHEGFGVRAAQLYQSLQEIEAAVLAARILKDPEGFDEYFKL